MRYARAYVDVRYKGKLETLGVLEQKIKSFKTKKAVQVSFNEENSCCK